MMFIPPPEPFVTVIIPCRNEERYVGRCLDSLMATDYPMHALEVLVVDGRSTDRTRTIIEGFADRYKSVRLVDNPHRVTPAALNLGVTLARGSIIVRMDAHATYPTSYVPKCVGYLTSTDADVVGGPITTVAGSYTVVGRAIALATSHRFGVGNSQFRTSQQEAYVDTVPFGAYRREVFDRCGLFDERLVRNQDNEFCSRILASGGRILMTPELTSMYFSQEKLIGLLRQAWRTGMWNIATIRCNRRAARLRHFAPMAFVTVVAVLAALVAQPFGRIGLALLIAAYALGAAVSAADIARREGVKLGLVALPIFVLYHVCYGLGSWAGIVRIVSTRWLSMSTPAVAIQ